MKNFDYTKLTNAFDSLQLKHIETSVNHQVNDTLFKAIYRGTDNGENTDGEMFQIAKENFVELYNKFLIPSIKDCPNRTPIEVHNIQPCNLIEAALSIDFHNDVAYGVVESDHTYRTIIILEHQSTYNKNMCFRELIYYVKILINYMQEHGIDLTKTTKQYLPEPEFYVIEFNNTDDSKTVYFEQKTEIINGYFLKITVIYITIYCKKTLSWAEEKTNHNSGSLLQYYAAFLCKTKLYRMEYTNALYDYKFEGINDYKFPTKFTKALCTAIDYEISFCNNTNRNSADFQKLQDKINNFWKNEVPFNTLSTYVNKAQKLGIKVNKLSGYNDYQKFNEFLIELKNRIVLNAYDKATKDFIKMLNNDPKNLVLQKFNKILSNLGGVTAMADFVEEIEEEISIYSIPFIQEKLAQKDAEMEAKLQEKLQEKDAEITAKLQEKDTEITAKLQEKDTEITAKLQEKDARISKLESLLKNAGIDID